MLSQPASNDGPNDGQKSALTHRKGGTMNRRRFAIAALALFAPCLFGANAPKAPVILSGTINYVSNQLTLTGSGLEPSRKPPVVEFNGNIVTLISASDEQIVAQL